MSGHFMIPKKAWEHYQDIVNNFIDKDAGRQPFLWLRKINQPSAFAEDAGPVYQPIAMEGLFHYNYILTWPTRHDSETGATDNGNCVLYISSKLLKSNGFLNEYGYWDFNWAEDKFVLNGRVYKIGTDTQVAQAGKDALLFFVVLRRCEEQEQETLLNSFSSPESQVVTPEGIWLVDSNGKRIKDLCGNPMRIPEGSKCIPCCKI